MTRSCVLLVFILFAGAVVSSERPAAAAECAFEEKTDRLILTDGGRPVATYVFSDKQIPRPYFMNVHAPGGVQVTRNHPPIKGKDSTDHDTLHPGLFMAFMNLNGQDFWRNKARVVHERFVEKPVGGREQCRFAVENRYVAADGKQVVCRETARHTFLLRPAGYLLIWDSTFQSDSEFYFADDKGMGLGVRVATPITVERGGTLDAAGRRNEREVMGKSSDWCDYSGIIEGRHAGVTLMCDPKNSRPTSYFARDYGLLNTNPFKGSKVLVKQGESLRLRYGVLLHSGPKDTAPNLKAAYADFLSKLQ